MAWADESQFQREDEAKALMKAAGFGSDHPLHVTLRFNQSENHNATAIAVADMWRVLGVTTEFVVTDATAYYAFLDSGQPYDVVRRGWFADYLRCAELPVPRRIRQSAQHPALERSRPSTR